MPPTVPINHYDGPRNQQNRTKRPILLFHANIFEQYACFEHSNFFKVKVPVRQEPQGLKVSQKERPRWKSSTRKNRTGQPGRFFPVSFTISRVFPVFFSDDFKFQGFFRMDGRTPCELIFGKIPGGNRGENSREIP